MAKYGMSMFNRYRFEICFMKTLLSFILFSLSFMGLGGAETFASDSRRALLEERDDEGFLKIFRESPKDFSADHLRTFLKRTMTLFSIDVTYKKKGQNFKGVLYRRFFKSEGYYFTFLTRHNLISETFLNLEDVKVEFMSNSSSGLQTKLHYNISLGNEEIPFSFRILYVSELNKKIADNAPLVQDYQKGKTRRLAKKVAHYSSRSGDWGETVKKQAQIEQDRKKETKEKSGEAKKTIEAYYLKSSMDFVQPKPSQGMEITSSSSSVNEKISPMQRKFFLHLLTRESSKSSDEIVAVSPLPEEVISLLQEKDIPKISLSSSDEEPYDVAQSDIEELFEEEADSE